MSPVDPKVMYDHPSSAPLFERPTPPAYPASPMFPNSGSMEHYQNPAPSWELRRTTGELVTDSRTYPSIRAALELGYFDKRNLSLRNLDLTGVRLPAKENLSGCDFTASCLDGLTLTDCDLRGVIFDETSGRVTIAWSDVRGASGTDHLLENGAHLHGVVRGRGVEDLGSEREDLGSERVTLIPAPEEGK